MYANEKRRRPGCQEWTAAGGSYSLVTDGVGGVMAWATGKTKAP